MKIRVYDERIYSLIDPHEEFVELASGLEWTEGPIWDYHNDRLIFSDIPPSRTMCWSEKEGLRELFYNGGKWNGLAFDPQGRILACEHAASRLMRCQPDGSEVEVLASHYEGVELNAPNDVIARSDGLIYFSDPIYGRNDEPAGVYRPYPSDRRPVYLLDPESGRIEIAAEGFGNPNGLCFSPDESLLYINDSPNYCIYVYDVAPDGRLSNQRLFAKTHGEDKTVPDGMKVDEFGNLICTAQDGLHYFDPQGNCLAVMVTPDIALNIVWGGPDGRYLYITCGHSILQLKTKARGWTHVCYLNGK